MGGVFLVFSYLVEGILDFHNEIFWKSKDFVRFNNECSEMGIIAHSQIIKSKIGWILTIK